MKTSAWAPWYTNYFRDCHFTSVLFYIDRPHTPLFLFLRIFVIFKIVNFIFNLDINWNFIFISFHFIFIYVYRLLLASQTRKSARHLHYQSLVAHLFTHWFPFGHKAGVMSVVPDNRILIGDYMTMTTSTATTTT